MSAEPDKENPIYEMKIIKINGENAIRRLCELQQNYHPSEVEVNRKVKKLFKYLEESYGSISNVRLYSKGMSLQPIVTEAVYHLFGKK
jgi:uncharacterized phage-associated protein